MRSNKNYHRLLRLPVNTSGSTTVGFNRLSLQSRVTASAVIRHPQRYLSSSITAMAAQEALKVSPNRRDMESLFDKMAKGYAKAPTADKSFTDDVIAMAPPVGPDSVIHDNACGTGAITKRLLLTYSGVPLNIKGTDMSAGMLEQAREATADAPGSITFEKMDSFDLKDIPDNTFTHSFSSLLFAYMTEEEAIKALKSILRTLKPGGTAVINGWEKLGWVEDVLKPAARAGRPGPDTEERFAKTAGIKAEQMKSWIPKAGFEADKTKVTLFGCEVNGANLANPAFEPVFEKMSSDITEGWTDEEKAVLKAEFRKAQQQQRENPTMMPCTQWAAVLKK